MLLRVKKIKVRAEGKEILKGVDLEIKKGEVQVLLGPNGSGKSVLAQTISGNPEYKVKEGKILFLGKDITRLTPEKRSKMGIALVWQTPPLLRGVKFADLLKKISKKEIKAEKIGAAVLLKREVNVGFSGGEKKVSELMQILSLDPKLVIFDEIDSGLDIKRLQRIAKVIKEELVEKGVSVLLITHWGQIVKFLKPDWTNVIVNGKIICKERDYKKVLRTIKKYGYEKCKKCPLLTG